MKPLFSLGLQRRQPHLLNWGYGIAAVCKKFVDLCGRICSLKVRCLSRLPGWIIAFKSSQSESF